MAPSPVEFFAAGTLLFFFWAYGVVSFVLDLKNKAIPAVRAYRRGSTAEDEEDEQDDLDRAKQIY